MEVACSMALRHGCVYPVNIAVISVKRTFHPESVICALRPITGGK